MCMIGMRGIVYMQEFIDCRGGHLRLVPFRQISRNKEHGI
jgi:hypothetical protein